MKLKRVRPGQYEGRLEPYVVSVFRSVYDENWTGILISDDSETKQLGARTKKMVEERLVAAWIRLRMTSLREKVPPNNLFSQLFNHSYWADRDDDASLLALRDYLEERGLTYIDDIIRDGRAAGVVWPGGWARLGG